MHKHGVLWTTAALGLGLLAPNAAHAQGQGGGPFADVPQTHWAYDAVNQLAQRGVFTGYPDGTFGGRRALTRYEFAVALQRMLQEVQRQIAAIQTRTGERGPAGPAGQNGGVGPRGPQGPAGPPGPVGVNPGVITQLQQQQTLLRNDVTALQRLAQEFSSELAMLGADVEQLKRNLQALADRMNRIEQTIARMPKITGAVNVGFRAASVTASGAGAGFEAAGAPPAPVTGLVDRDGRFLNPSSSLLERVNAFYDIDLGVTAQISDVATARLLLNAGNYLRGYLGNRLSQVNPVIDGGVEGLVGTPGGAVPGLTFEDVLPYYLYIETPVKLGPVGAQLTVGKFGHQFTPYTLKMVDVDSYFYNDKTDLGDYPLTGARANFRALGLNFNLYGAVHQHEYSQLSSTAGFLSHGYYDPDTGRFRPFGDVIAGLAAANPLTGLASPGFGSTLIEQSFGGRVSYVGKRVQVGATYLTGAGSASDVPGIADVFRQLHVYGFDINANILRNVGLSLAVTESRWDGQFEQNTQKFFGLGKNSERRAVDARIKFPIGRLLLTGYYKDIGSGFDAPGSWGRMGNWINPRGIDGFGGTLELPIGRRLVLDAEGAVYNYNLFSRTPGVGFANNADLTYLRAGLRFPLTSRNSVDFGYERLDIDPNGKIAGIGAVVDRLEQYYNIGFSHQFSPNMSFRLLYQLMNTKSGGAFFDFPGFNYEAQIIATQFQVRF